ncbi:unnamed protein product [Enterobius vermicularis]|uniref:C-type lectin domain-containing protein n=1 Tax=Enterobius vermicularis TaxID=51028 RepID=A0A0N4V4V9_ENTVE|nr:unnamed protein product [Enterobius vermicularis]
MLSQEEIDTSRGFSNSYFWSGYRKIDRTWKWLNGRKSNFTFWVAGLPVKDGKHALSDENGEWKLVGNEMCAESLCFLKADSFYSSRQQVSLTAEALTPVREKVFAKVTSVCSSSCTVEFPTLLTILQNTASDNENKSPEDYVRAKTSRRIIRPFIVIAENNWILIYMVELCCMTVIFVGVMVAVFGKTSREPHFTPLHSTK